MDTEIWTRNSNKPPTKIKTKSTELAYAKIINVTTILKFIVDILTMYIIKKSIAEHSFDLRTAGLWAQHASTAPLCFHTTKNEENYYKDFRKDRYT